jgi:undecaprenyl-diphosphatase
MSLLQAIIIAIIEGLTEFLPISSTAHMRITESLLGISLTDKFTEAFTVAIQLGAILSVVVLYWKKFFNFKQSSFYIKLSLAVVPALVFGKLFSDRIDMILETPLFISLILLVGGVLLLFADKWFNRSSIKEEQHINIFSAIKIGCFQCLAILFPGLSRSAATIIGGMSLGLTRSLAAEFSFFLAVPTMLAATIYKLYKYTKENGAFTNPQIQLLAIGNIVAFIVAIMAIRLFTDVLKRYGFKIWGIYRIVVGLALLLLIWQGII